MSAELGSHRDGGEERSSAPAVGLVDEHFDAPRLARLRAMTREAIRKCGASAEVIEDVAVVVSELAGNAVRHAGGGGRLKLWLQHGLLHCEVSDNGPGFDGARVGHRLPSQTASNGRGIWTCRQLCLDLWFAQGAGGRGTVATAVLPLVASNDIDRAGWSRCEEACSSAIIAM